MHTGHNVEMKLLPAPENSGFRFRRIDLENQPEIEALAIHVAETERGTTLRKGEAAVHTIEHVLAALVGSGVDNCTIELNAPEPPILDGSAMGFVEAIESVGLKEQRASRDYLVLQDLVQYSDPIKGVEIIGMPYDGFSLTVLVDYRTDVLGSQNASLEKISDFKSEIAKARTFSFLHELEYLLDNGLIKGGDLNNAIVYVDKSPSADSMEKLKKAFGKETVSVKANGILDNLELHYSNEAARHKLLDWVGDLALVGRPLKGRFFARRPGHKGNTDFAKLLLEKIRKDGRIGVPKYDPEAPVVMDIDQVMRMLPHRPPFLFVDKITELSDNHVVGIKNVTMNEAFFVGHFPSAPVMPGVLIIESMAQVGGILALSFFPDPENYLTFFMKIDNVRFKHKVIPGDTLIFELKMMSPMRRGIIQMKGQAFVGTKLVTEAELMAQIARKDKK